jgi:hypothetical protein
VNELDRLRRQMRLKDLLDMIHRLEHLKSHAKTSQEIINTLEDIKENLEYLEADVNKKKLLSSLSFIRMMFYLATKFNSRCDYLVIIEW